MARELSGRRKQRKLHSLIKQESVEISDDKAKLVHSEVKQVRKCSIGSSEEPILITDDDEIKMEDSKSPEIVELSDSDNSIDKPCMKVKFQKNNIISSSSSSDDDDDEGVSDELHGGLGNALSSLTEFTVLHPKYCQFKPDQPDLGCSQPEDSGCNCRVSGNSP